MTTGSKRWTLSPDRCFDPDPATRGPARELYEGVKDLPLVSPHGHVPPALLADPAARLGTPTELFIIPDHYVFRMLYSLFSLKGDKEIRRQGDWAIGVISLSPCLKWRIDA